MTIYKYYARVSFTCVDKYKEMIPHKIVGPYVFLFFVKHKLELFFI